MPSKRPAKTAPVRARRGPGRPPSADTAHTRERILQTAMLYFGRRGREGASVRSIATESGVTLATVLHHFHDKASLFDSCVTAAQEQLAEAGERFIGAVSGHDSVEEIARAATRVALDIAFESRDALRVVIGETLASGRSPAIMFERGTLPTIERFGALLVKDARPAAQARLVSQTFFHVLCRYALSEPDELARIVGVEGPGTGPDGELSQTIRDEIERHLIDLVIRFMRPTGADTANA
ncbi:MAG: TetR/AcrR family transcriptional regulator [Deltaproteobacteria bacterium]|nr:MAG: TetR/AcrR family transcriptional regulator [Deltaproteobacteria bacterium]